MAVVSGVFADSSDKPDQSCKQAQIGVTYNLAIDKEYGWV